MDGKENGGCFAVEEGVKYDDARKVPDFSEAELEAAIEVRRPVFRTQQFREKYLKASPPGRSFKEQIQGYLRSACHCSSERCRKFCCGIFPCIRIVRKYKWQSDLPSDVIAGLTVGIMQLPQGMAYALLAELPPVVGLYVSFFPILMYFLFGTSRQIAMGTVAVVSLMVGTVVSRTTESSSLSAPLNSTYMTANSSDGHSVDLDAEKIKVAACLAFMVGIAQLVMGFLQLGFITTFMSDSLVSGFTTGAAVHVFTSQVKYVLGLHPKRFGGIFQIVFTYSEIIKNISHTNLVELLISSICIVVLYVFKVQINQRFKARMKVPIPIELFVVVIGTVASHYGHFREKYRIRIVGEIPAGLPKPIFPDLNKAGNYIADVIPLAIVAFAQSVSLAALMAKKHNYDIDSNKELFAYGVGNLFGSFFSCYPFAASVSRTSVLDSAGGKTQIASLISCFLVLIVILAIGPLFKSLPNCILSAIIMVALRTMLLQVLELKNLWRVSRYDFAIWSVTFIGAVVLHVDFGLGIGIAFSIFTVVLRTQRSRRLQNVAVSPTVHQLSHRRLDLPYSLSREFWCCCPLSG